MKTCQTCQHYSGEIQVRTPDGLKRDPGYCLEFVAPRWAPTAPTWTCSKWQRAETEAEEDDR